MSISKPKKPINYINNKAFFEAMVEYKKQLARAKREKTEKPRVSEYIGQCLLHIANGLGTKGNFSGYSFLSEMKSDGIENCLMYISSFDPKKSQNPFAYFTQIIKWAFIRRIKKEAKQHHLKLKNMENAIFSSECPQQADLDFLYNDINIAFLKHQEQIVTDKKNKMVQKKRLITRENNKKIKKRIKVK